MQLLNKFFNMNADIYLTTTANKDVANIWEAFGATTVKPNLTNLVIYKILFPYNFINSFFILKKKYVPKLIMKLLSCFLKIYLKRKIDTREKLNLKLLDLDIDDSYLENFNKNYENKIQEPSEKRSSYNLKWYLGLIKYDKKILIKKIIINNIPIGYVVIVAKNEKKIDLKTITIIKVNPTHLKKMKFVFANAKRCQQFAAIFASLKTFTENVSLYFKPDQMYIQCMDDSHCSLFECRLSSKWFKTYEFDPASDMGQIAINIVMLNKVLNTWNDTQEMIIELQPESDKIHISFENGNTDTSQFNKYFELSLIDLENQLLDAIVSDTLVDMSVESKIFHSLVNQLTIFNDNLKITFYEDDVEFMSSGTDGSMTAKIKAEDLAEYAISEGSVLTQTYSLRYVQMMCQFNKLATEMILGFSAEMPMTMKYMLGNNNDTESFVRIHLAPKIPDDE